MGGSVSEGDGNGGDTRNTAGTGATSGGDISGQERNGSATGVGAVPSTAIVALGATWLGLDAAGDAVAMVATLSRGAQSNKGSGAGATR